MKTIKINRPPNPPPPPATSVTVELTPEEVSIIRELMNYSNGDHTDDLYRAFTDLRRDMGGPKVQIRRASSGATPVVNTVKVL